MSNLLLSGAEQAGGVKRGASTGSGQKQGGIYSCRVNSWLVWGGGDGFREVGGGGYGGERKSALFFSFVKQRRSRTWFSDALLAAVGELCMETGVYWRFDLPEEVQKRTVKGWRAVADLISINLSEVMAMLMTAYVMIDMNGERPRRRGEAVLMRADNEAVVTWVRRFRGGKGKQARVGALMRIMGALVAKGRWCFQARHGRGVDKKLADGLTRWQEGQILQKLNKECPGIA